MKSVFEHITHTLKGYSHQNFLSLKSFSQNINNTTTSTSLFVPSFLSNFHLLLNSKRKVKVHVFQSISVITFSNARTITGWIQVQKGAKTRQKYEGRPFSRISRDTNLPTFPLLLPQAGVSLALHIIHLFLKRFPKFPETFQSRYLDNFSHLICFLLIQANISSQTLFRHHFLLGRLTKSSVYLDACSEHCSKNIVLHQMKDYHAPPPP